MAKYRKKPVVIEAVQYDGNTIEFGSELDKLVRSQERRVEDHLDYLIIETLEGDHKAKKGDWIIKGVNDELYPCKPDIFEKTYEAV